MKLSPVIFAAAFAGVSFFQPQASAQPPESPAAGRAGRGPQAPAFVSPEVLPDHRVTFRILAPQAETVALRGGDIPQLAGGGRGAPPNPGPTFTKAENGVWEATIGPIDPGAYRYNFLISGVTVLDTHNPSISESNATVWSLFTVPGSDLMDTRNVPARRGVFGDLLLDRTGQIPPHACLYAAGL